MPSYTIELGSIVQYRDIGLQDYPIFDESYRPILNDIIIEHFRFREIGFETVDMFVNRLNHQMRLDMPSHNRVYKAMEEDFNPLTNLFIKTTGSKLSVGDVKRIANSSANSVDDVLTVMKDIAQQTNNTLSERKRDGQSTAESKSGSKSRSVGSQFPQQMLSATGDYATDGSDSVSETTSNTKGNELITESDKNTGTIGTENDNTKTDKRETTSTDNTTDHSSINGDEQTTTLVTGRTGSIMALIAEYRDSLVSADRLVLNSLEPLFMQLFSNNDGYTHSNYNNYLWPYFGY